MSKTKTILEEPAVCEASAVTMEVCPSVTVPPALRRLKWNELVCRGDFVENGCLGFEPWEGPAGFRADTFVKPVYRKRGRRPGGTESFT
jgi:hypothetical protein